MCVLIAPLTRLPHLSLLLGPPYSLRHNNVEMSSIHNPSVASKCSSIGKCLTPLTLNQKLQMIKLREEGMSKAKRGRKLGLLCQLGVANEKLLMKINKMNKMCVTRFIAVFASLQRSDTTTSLRSACSVSCS